MSHPSPYPNGTITATSVVEQVAKGRTDFSGYNIQGPYRNRTFDRTLGLEVVSAVVMQAIDFSDSRLSGPLDWKLVDCILVGTDKADARFPVDAAQDKRPYNLKDLPEDLYRLGFDLLFKEHTPQQKQPATLPWREFVKELKQLAALLYPAMAQIDQTVKGFAQAFYSQPQKQQNTVTVPPKQAAPTYTNVVPRDVAESLAAKTDTAVAKIKDSTTEVESQFTAMRDAFTRNQGPHAARIQHQRLHAPKERSI